MHKTARVKLHAYQLILKAHLVLSGVDNTRDDTYALETR